MSFRPKLSGVLALTSVLAGPAYAADVTADQAAILQSQLQIWIGLLSMSNATASMGPQPTKVTPDGDHFRVDILAPPSLVQQGVLADAPMATVLATPIDGGRYKFDGLTVPSPQKITLPASMTAQLMAGYAGANGAPGKPGTPPAPAAPASPPPPALPIVVETTTKGQSLTGVLDPTLATPTTFDTALGSLHATAMSLVADLTDIKSRGKWVPVGGGLGNMTRDTSFKNISVTGISKSGDPFAVFVAGGSAANEIDGAPPGYAASLNASVAALTSAMKQGGDKPITPEQRRAAHDAVQGINSALVNQVSSTSFDGLKVATNGQTTEIKHASFSGGFATDAGKLTVSSTFSIEGIASTAIPEGPYRDMLPSRVVLNPRIYGISRADALALANHAIDADMKDPAQSNALQVEALGLLAKGPVGIAIDQLVLEIPGTTLKGAATVEMPSPADITVHALLTMDGLDDLIQKANTTPELQQGGPVLIFLKGIGKADGKTTTWNVSYQGGKIVVNDTDLSAMLPGNQPPQPRPQPKPARPLAPKTP